MKLPTPGPWTMSGDEITAHGVVICQLAEDDMLSGGGTMIGNGRLIAAAPALRGQLTFLADELEQHVESAAAFDPLYNPAGPRARITAARAILARIDNELGWELGEWPSGAK